jgi:PAS domain S-box-containing protein
MRKPHTTPIEKETILTDNDFVVSKTDLKSRIKYGNEYFIKISGWEEKELLGAPHNILRHPDMPKVAFKILYEMLDKNEEFFGFIKNLRKDGGYYWVFASISPDYDVNGKKIGYYAVRRKCRDGFKKVVEPLYKKLVDLEKSGGMEASYKAVQELLKEKNMTLNEFTLAIQKGEINEL